jgi:hypothetical protein
MKGIAKPPTTAKSGSKDEVAIARTTPIAVASAAIDHIRMRYGRGIAVEFEDLSFMHLVSATRSTGSTL